MAGTAAASPTSATLVDVAYGYDLHARAGDRTWRRDNAAHAQTNGQQNNHAAYYHHDGLRQVTGADRGNLTGTAPNYTGITNVQRAEDWCYDTTGNWRNYTDDQPGTGSDLSQARTHNKANEITGITNPSTVPTPSYDAAGNMTATPTPADWNSANTLKWDAWNRLVEVKSGTTVVQTNRYDGLKYSFTSKTCDRSVDYGFKSDLVKVASIVSTNKAGDRLGSESNYRVTIKSCCCPSNKSAKWFSRPQIPPGDDRKDKSSFGNEIKPFNP